MSVYGYSAVKKHFLCKHTKVKHTHHIALNDENHSINDIKHNTMLDIKVSTMQHHCNTNLTTEYYRCKLNLANIRKPRPCL